MLLTDSFILTMAIGLKLALLAFIFQEKLLGTLKKFSAAQQSIAVEEAQEESLASQKEQQIKEIDLEQPEALMVEETKINCLEEDPETDSGEEDSSILEEADSSGCQQISNNVAQKLAQQSRKKCVSFVNIARNIVAVSLLGAKVNSSAASKAVYPLEGLKKADLSEFSSQNTSSYLKDFEGLTSILHCEGSKDECGLLTGQGSVLDLPALLNSSDYKSKRGTRLISKYSRFAQRKEDLVLVKNKRRNLAAKLTKLTRAILKNRPQSSELHSIKEETY